MRILLDENLPKRLKQNFPKHEIYTVRDREWNGLKNGELMKKLLENDFQVFITFDKNLEYQQNFSKFQITVLTIKAIDYTYLTLKEFVPALKRALEGKLKPAVTLID